MLWVSREPPSSLTRNWWWSQWWVHCVSALLHYVSVWSVSAWAESAAALYSCRSFCNVFFEQGRATELSTWTPSSPTFGKCLQCWSKTATYLPHKGKSTNLFSFECCANNYCIFGNIEVFRQQLLHLVAGRSEQNYHFRIVEKFSMEKQGIQPAWVAEDDSALHIDTVTCRTHNKKTLIVHFCILSLQTFMGMCSAFVWEGTKLCLFRGGRWWRRPWWHRLITLWTVLTVRWSPGFIPETQVNTENTQAGHKIYWKNILVFCQVKFCGVLLFSAGLFFSNGAVWRRQRRFAMTVLRTFSLTNSSMEQRLWEESQQLQEAMEKEKGGPKTKEWLNTQACTHTVYRDLTFLLRGAFWPSATVEQRRGQHHMPDRFWETLWLQRCHLPEHAWQSGADGLPGGLHMGSGTVFRQTNNAVMSKSTWTSATLPEPDQTNRAPVVSKQLYDSFPVLMQHLPGPHNRIFSSSRSLEASIRAEVEKHKLDLDPSSPRDYIDAFLIEKEVCY